MNAKLTEAFCRLVSFKLSLIWLRSVLILARYVNTKLKINTSHLEANAGFFRLLTKEIFDSYVLSPFDKKMIS